MAPENTNKMPYEMVLSGMLEKIKNNTYQVGHFIPSERKLAEEYGVSRTVVHEAIRILWANGYIDSRPGGKRILVRNENAISDKQLYAALEQSQVEEFLEARIYLDDIVAVLACRRATPEDLNTIEKIYERLCVYSSSENADILSNSWTQFHMEVANATHNSVLISLYHLLLTMMPTYRQNTLSTRQARLKMLKEHKDIYTALKAKDEMEALIATHLHNRNVKERYFGNIEQSRN